MKTIEIMFVFETMDRMKCLSWKKFFQTEDLIFCCFLSVLPKFSDFSNRAEVAICTGQNWSCDF